MTIEAAIEEVEQDLERRATDQEVFAALEDFIWSEAASGRVTLWGRRWNENSRKPDPEYITIPKSFFLRRAKYSCGNGYHGKGELARWPDDDSEQGLADSIFKSDAPVTYVEIKLSRSDALALHAFRKNHMADENREKQHRQTRARVILDRDWWPWDVGLAHLWTNGDREFVEAIAGRPDPGQLCMTGLVLRSANFESFHGRKLVLKFASADDAWHALRAKIADQKIAARGHATEGPT